jgi:L-ascorbate metabolism protein UlaG (beta-lactamase superfamily)
MNYLSLSLLLMQPLLLLAQHANPSQVFKSSAGTVKITPIYHATLRIEAGGRTIYVDPARPANLAGAPKADLILITHTHSDHLDPLSIDALRQPGTEIWGPQAAAPALPGMHRIANGESHIWEGWTIEAVPMYNLVRGPAPGRLYHRKGEGNGYILTYGGLRIYISGDTENTPELRALKNIDIAFVCMNLPYTMTPEEAAEGVKAFHPKVVIPYHYSGTDLRIFQHLLQGSGIEVRLLDWYPR